MWKEARRWLLGYSCAGFTKHTYLLQFFLLLLLIFFTFSSSSNNGFSSCGDIRNISCPFYLKGDLNHNCNSHNLLSQELHCQDNRTIVYLTYYGDYVNLTNKYHVADINYQNYTVRLIDTYENQTSIRLSDMFASSIGSYNIPITFISCPDPVTSDFRYIDITTTDAFSNCSSNNTYNYTTSFSGKNNCRGEYSYVLAVPISLYDVVDGCELSEAAWLSSDWQSRFIDKSNITIISKADDEDIFSEIMAYGFDFSWESIFCSSSCEPSYICNLDHQVHAYKCHLQLYSESFSPHKRLATIKLVAVILPCTFLVVLGIIFLYYFIQFRADKQKKEDELKIKMFMEDYKARKPTRYSYSDIKKITNMFKHKLGQGGYGTVFKGQISSDILVAVKVLHSDSRANGDDFINEVGTIGKIHHVNVVRLLGYCADGCNRALVYEFQPNHSLEKFVYRSEKQHSFIGWKKMQRIALGIAKGIKYLHQGCEQQILHFDIKPNNILLDKNFNPKISDFGLAKLCNKGQSNVSMTAARGTIGYIAPEVFSRNFGKVSSKSDVYSFGMLLLEMVGGKSNNVVGEQNTSDVYFPEWIFHRLEKGGELVIQIENEDDGKIARKLTIVGLWCIGWHPIDRPSMKLVIQMLEADECPAMPPNPFSSTTSEKATRAKSFFSERLQVVSEAE